MKKLIRYVLLIITTAISLQVSAGQTFRDPGDTWPWGYEMPFPWKGIQGTWETEIQGRTVYLSFQTVRSTGSKNQLGIVQYDAKTCEVLARGRGFEDNKVVTAALVGRAGYLNMTVHVFGSEDLKANDGVYTDDGSKTVTVMKLSPWGLPDRFESYQLYKLTSNPEAVCE
ncbi:MAG: hypothetical protein COT73_06950 [Bdellovibrio sp. CG10_big_fil_rev_8_21_14_0_10_47_8]|nr:MAG: hypothetical protein COT73_06950 [Bdellovibrio sp. CG10_big_fil_rev_8_21_14_0_10_47_8]